MTLPISLPLGLIKGLRCAQLPSLGGTGPRVWDLGKLMSTAMADVLVMKLKDKKKMAKVQGSSSAVLLSVDSKDGARSTL